MVSILTTGSFELVDALDFTVSLTCFYIILYVPVMKVNSLSRLAQGTPDGDSNVAIDSQNSALKSSALQVSEIFTFIAMCTWFLSRCASFIFFRHFSTGLLYNSPAFYCLLGA